MGDRKITTILFDAYAETHRAIHHRETIPERQSRENDSEPCQ